mmetsp:Transcript_20476/g.51746  ORF Transcript_20476/g.51746 Transcript_20476/m.51746 type:complete len:218 (-) Transcript_20476:18-671(-)
MMMCGRSCRCGAGRGELRGWLSLRSDCAIPVAHDCSEVACAARAPATHWSLLAPTHGSLIAARRSPPNHLVNRPRIELAAAPAPGVVREGRYLAQRPQHEPALPLAMMRVGGCWPTGPAVIARGAPHAWCPRRGTTSIPISRVLLLVAVEFVVPGAVELRLRDFGRRGTERGKSSPPRIALAFISVRRSQPCARPRQRARGVHFLFLFRAIIGCSYP